MDKCRTICITLLLNTSTTGWPVKHSRVVLVPWKTWLIQCRLLYSSVCVLVSLYQNNTTMFNWPPHKIYISYNADLSFYERWKKLCCFYTSIALLTDTQFLHFPLLTNIQIEYCIDWRRRWLFAILQTNRFTIYDADT